MPVSHPTLPRHLLGALTLAFTLTQALTAADAPPATAPAIPETCELAAAGDLKITVREVLLRAIRSDGDAALQKLLTRRLIELEAHKRGIQITPAELAQVLQNDLTGYRADLAQSDPANAPTTSDDQLIRARFHEPLTTYRDRDLYPALLLQALVTKNLDLTPAALAAWFEQEKDHYGVPAQYIVRHILIRFSNDPESDAVKTVQQREAERAQRQAAVLRAQTKINEIFQLIKAGQPFEQMEHKYSEELPEIKARGGALLPFTINSALDENFIAATRTLKIGECSAPVMTAFGYHLILLDKIIPGQYPAYDQVKDRVRKDYLRKTALERAGPFVDALSRTTEVTHFPNLYPSANEDLTADPAADKDGRIDSADCIAAVGRIAPGEKVPLEVAITRHQFYGELFRTAGQRYLSERHAIGLFMQSIRKMPGEPSEMEVSRLFSSDQIHCYEVQDQAIAQAKLLGLPLPERRKFYDYMREVTGQNPVELKEEARERAALWKFMQMNHPWTEDDLTRYYYIEQERYDLPGTLNLSAILIKPQTDGANPSPTAEAWAAAAARARALYQRLKGGGLPVDADNREHPDAVSWTTAAKTLSDEPERIREAAGAWPELAVLRVAKTAEAAPAGGSAYSYLVEDCDPLIGAEALQLVDHQVSAPVRGADGFYILRRESFSPPFARAFTEPEVHAQVERDYVSPRIRTNLQPVLDTLIKATPLKIDEARFARLCAQ